MKLKFKKPLVVLLALAMIMAMSVTAFADTNSTMVDATVNFAVEGETYVTESISFDADNFNHVFTIDPAADYTITVPTVLDSILQAYGQYNPGFGTDAVTYNWDLNPASGPDGVYINKFDGIDPAVTSYTWHDIGDTRYYTMTGNSWMINVNGSPITSYASSVVLNDNDVVTISYDEYEENWTSPIPASK